jgi:uncharacterized membrane protein YoaT (DUF817 family)
MIDYARTQFLKLWHSQPQKAWQSHLLEFLFFGLKQAWACLFGGLLLGLILVTRLWWPDGMPIARYDALFIGAILIQIGLLAFRLETLHEAKVILIFHIIGTIMEIFKTAHGSWIYPEANLIRIGGVPLFSGFMYAAVGSYIARITRLFNMRYNNYPPLSLTYILATVIYINFFTHHFTIDCRGLLFLAMGAIYGQTVIGFTPWRQRRTMPMVIGCVLVTVFIWLAENIGTFGMIWLYPHQQRAWHMVSTAKAGSWFLLMVISFVLVTVIHKPRSFNEAPDPVD